MPVRPSPALQDVLFPHESDQRAPRAGEGPDHSALGPRGGLSTERPSARPPTERFTANTCKKCGATTLHGIADGITRHLEPRALTDHGEYHAIAAGLRTYNLHPDRTAMPRTISHIAAPDRHPRLAQHACGHEYGDQALPGPRPRPADHDDPPF